MDEESLLKLESKDKESAYSFQKGLHFANTLTLVQCDIWHPSNLYNCKTINLCWFKLLNLWTFVSVTIGTLTQGQWQVPLLCWLQRSFFSLPSHWLPLSSVIRDFVCHEAFLVPNHIDLISFSHCPVGKKKKRVNLKWREKQRSETRTLQNIQHFHNVNGTFYVCFSVQTEIK